jgi:hypothetical protein
MSSITASVFGECVSPIQALCISTSMRVCETIRPASKINNDRGAGKPVPAISLSEIMARLIPNQATSGSLVIMVT